MLEIEPHCVTSAPPTAPAPKDPNETPYPTTLPLTPCAK
jgi:hypothetical protein